MASTTYLQRTVSTTGSRRKATFSAWIKKSGQGEQWFLNSGGNNSTGYNIKIGFGSTDEIFIINSSGSTNLRYQTTRLLRDNNSWYHIVVALDTENSTSGDRVKVYINGNRETSFFNVTTPSQNLDLEMNQNTSSKNLMAIGTRYNSGDLFNGLMSHVQWIDGTAYDASAFGSTDSVTGEWQINTSPSVTYGTNGFFILKDGNSVTDQSGQSNNLTVGGGTLTKTEDCPSNVFATLNPLASLPNTGVSTFTNGNTTSQGVNGSYVNGGSNLQMSSGKWYAECKYIATSSDVGRMIIGITQDVSEISRINQDTGSYNTYLNNYDGAGAKSVQGSNPSSYGNAYGVNDIIGIALDLDNEKLYFSINGTWQNSGVPTSGSTGTGAITGFSSPSSSISGGYFFFSGSNSNAQNNTVSWNFGNGYFGTTAVSSAGTNASGNGIFEYDCPAGFTALSTKGLNL